MKYRIFVEQLSGQRFVEDIDIVTAKLAVLNERMGQTGELSANDFYRMFDLKPEYEDVVFTVLKGTLFQLRPTYVGNVSVVAIGIERIEWDEWDELKNVDNWEKSLNSLDHEDYVEFED